MSPRGIDWLKGLVARMPEEQGYAPLPLTSASSPIEMPIAEKDEWEVKPTAVRRRMRWSFLYFLLPSFLHPRRRSSDHGRHLRSSWLDGLRGIAAFVVVWHHSSLIYFSWDIHNPWTSPSSWFIQLPLIRLVVGGIPAVCLFFVVSGYAISLKLLKLSHMGKTDAFADALCSSLFRRHPRLFMPTVGVLLITAFLSFFGAFPMENWADHVAIATRVPPRGETLWQTLLMWADNCWEMANPLRDTVNSRDWSPWDPNLWTLPVEFGCSMLVFALLAVMHKFGPFTRMGFTLSLVFYCLLNAEQNVFLFLSGVFLADIRTYLTIKGCQRATLPAIEITNAEGRPPATRPRKAWELPTIKNAIVFLAFLLCLFILSMPELGRGASDAPGYQTLTSLIPQRYHDSGRGDYFWVPIAATSLIAVVDSAPFLQKLFTSRFAQYLGDISFSLYLVHGPLLWSWGARVAGWVFALTGTESQGQYAVGVILCYMALWPVVIYEADLVTRAIDLKCVAFARWAYGKLAR